MFVLFIKKKPFPIKLLEIALAMRHSKSIPEHASTGLLPGSKNKLVHKWPSINIDSGISLCSFDTQYKTMEMKST